MTAPSRVPIVDECRLCGLIKPLSFEHVPPRFRPDARQYLAHLYQGGPTPAVIEESRGAGAYTLCEVCNKRCGRYAMEFIEWAVFWQLALDPSPHAPVITAAPMTRRSRVMKEIVAMTLSASPPKTGRLGPREIARLAERRGERATPRTTRAARPRFA